MSLTLEPLDKARHDRRSFSCGAKPLDDYLRQQAAKHQTQGVSITYVLVSAAAPDRILGFFTLAAGQVERTELREREQKKLPPYPVPVVRLARLGVDVGEQGKQYGTLLLSLAVEKTAAAGEYAGIYALVVDAKAERAKQFYQHHGFYELQSDSMTLFLPLAEAAVLTV
jgi:GNAT superfamily N-acetyltransferase